jgi:hypothetical protein
MEIYGLCQKLPVETCRLIGHQQGVTRIQHEVKGLPDNKADSTLRGYFHGQDLDEFIITAIYQVLLDHTGLTPSMTL